MSNQRKKIDDWKEGFPVKGTDEEKINENKEKFLFSIDF